LPSKQMSPEAVDGKNIPLADRMRPLDLHSFFGQYHLVGEGKFVRRLIETRCLPSLILWGPPGSGKTTLARIIARSNDAHFVFFSAVLSGVQEIRQVIAEAKDKRDQRGLKTILFVDEIHRFNKGQQDAFLPHVENGLLTLIGATTENPSFYVIAPLLSRCRVVVLRPLTEEDILLILKQAIADPEKGLGKLNLLFEKGSLEFLAQMADGDARTALNGLETSVSLALQDNQDNNENISHITLSLMEEAVGRKGLRYDRAGDEHYGLISALHKSLRDSDPDAALYWLLRMLIAGEDPLYISRRLIRFASEDIGNADPQALILAMAAQDSYRTLGSPEGELALAQSAVYLATAAKSNALYVAFDRVKEDIAKTGSLPVPLHLRNAPTRLMKEIGFGAGYQYAHDHEHAVVDQEHLPQELAGHTWYVPSNRGYEAIIRDRLIKWQEIKKKRAGKK